VVVGSGVSLGLGVLVWGGVGDDVGVLVCVGVFVGELPPIAPHPVRSAIPVAAAQHASAIRQ
jgi:hypothetical protein